MNLTSPCGECFMEMHIYGHYLDLIFEQDTPHSCVKKGATSGAWSLLLRTKHWPISPETLYMFLSITVTITVTLLFLNCNGPLTMRDRRYRQVLR